MAQHRLPKGPSGSIIDLEEVFRVAQRLNMLVLAESELLSAMRVRDLFSVQEEKHQLSQAFDRYQKAIATDNQSVAAASPEVRDRLYTMAAELAANIEENMRLTAIAQTVNRSVMQTFVSILAEQQRAATYSENGQHDMSAPVTVSININERA